MILGFESGDLSKRISPLDPKYHAYLLYDPLLLLPLIPLNLLPPPDLLFDLSLHILHLPRVLNLIPLNNGLQKINPIIQELVGLVLQEIL